MKPLGSQIIRQTARDIGWQVLSLSFLSKKKVDPDEIAPFLGHYYNDVLGEVELNLDQDNSFWVDFGEYKSEIRPLVLEGNQFIFFESVFIGKTLTLSMGTIGNVTMCWPGDEDVYVFRK